LTRAEVEAVAMALPTATKVTLWRRLDVYKVRRKVFASCGLDEGLTFRATEIAYAVLTDGDPGRPAPGFVPGGWVNIPLADLEPAEPADWIRTSYGLATAALPRRARAELGLA